VSTGTVISFNQDKGWGFASSDSGDSDVMLHTREFCDPLDVARLAEGVRVTFELRRTARGLRAVSVRLAEAADTGFLAEMSGVLREAEQRLTAIARKYGVT
jgi:CspA family cold shock protein